MKKMISVILSIMMIVTMCMSTYAASFSDVGDEFSWASDAIERFCAEGIIEGRGDGSFAPEQSVTRAEFAKMLALTFKLTQSSETVYSDVADGTWEHTYISLADKYTVSAEVLDSAHTQGEYAPEKEASRQEIAAALVNVIGNIKAEGEYLKDRFTDSGAVNSALYDSVNAAAQAGLIKGYEDNTLRPGGNVTRAEAVVLLDRARVYSASQNTPSPSPSIAPSPSPSAVPVEKPKAANDIISVVDISMTSIDGEKFYSMRYAFGGVIANEPLVVLEDASIGGLKSKISEIECGDMIIYNLHVSGKVSAIRVVYSPGESMPSSEESLDTLMSLPPSMNWGLYDSDKTTQIYFGRIDKTQTAQDGVIVRMKYMNDTNQAVLVPYDGVRVSVYKPYVYSVEKRFEPVEARDISSGYEFDHDYIFIKVKRDIVTDVIVVDYEK